MEMFIMNNNPAEPVRNLKGADNNSDDQNRDHRRDTDFY